MPTPALDSTTTAPPLDVQPTTQTSTGIRQRVIAVDAGQRTQLLRHLIKQSDWPRVLIFVATKHAAEMVADKLRKTGLSAEPLHNQLSQGKRTQVWLDFKAGRLRAVVATEAAVRGLALPPLPLLANYDLPRSALDYSYCLDCVAPGGWVLSFVSVDTEAHFSLIEKRQQLNLPREQIAGFEPLQTATTAEPSTGGTKGRRPNKKDKLRSAANPGH